MAASVAVAPAAPLPPAPPSVPAPLRRPPPPPVPTWWERASTVLLENWTGILGAVVLVTGVGFLGVYAALRLAPPFRFLMICAFAGGLLGGRFALRGKAFAQQLNGWLLSSAAAIFLFACVAAVSVPGLRWATPPFDYLLLLAGVSANLWLAWRASRQDVSTLHGVLSLVALAVLPPTGLTLAAAAGVTAFGIAITYRQLWKYQLLLGIVSFFAFHLYWHQQLATVSGSLRLVAMGLVLLVGVAAAVVQYRSVYSKRTFEPVLFAAHLLNWTCMGINLYLYSTGSIWKTIPLALGSLLTFWAGRRAKQLGIGWLFQTDTIIALMLALATAFSLQGWHATNSVILLFMLLEALLVALIMARQREALVYRVALGGACLAGVGLLLLAGSQLLINPPAKLYRDALVLTLAGSAGVAFVRFIFQQALLHDEPATPATPLWEAATLPREGAAAIRSEDPATAPRPVADAASHPEATAAATQSHRYLLGGFAGVAGLLQAAAGVLLTRVLFAWADAPVGLLLAGLLGLAAAALALAAWLRTSDRIPEWVRQQQLLLAQGFGLLASLGLHELGVAWPVVLGLLYAENLALALLALRQREALLYRVALGGALLAGASLLMTAGGTAGGNHPPELYRDALVLALAGWAGIACARRTFGQLQLATLSGTRFQAFTPADNTWISGSAGLSGILQLGAALLLIRVVFAWADAPVGLLLAGLLGLAAAALALAAWLRSHTAVPAWVRRQQLVLAQAVVMLAILGLHKTGLSWPAVFLVLYAENLLAALLLNGRDEDALLHTQTYLLVLQAAILPLLVRYPEPYALGLLPRAALLAGAALLTVGYQVRARFLPEANRELAVLQLGAKLQIPALGLGAGWLLLNAGALVYDQKWAAWALVALLGGLLVLRQRVAAPGLWAGLVLAAVGYLALQWGHVLAPSPGPEFAPGYVLLYLLPTLAVPVVGVLASWWPAGGRFVRWPWLYLLTLHLVVALVAAVPAGHVAYLAVGLLLLAGLAFGAAQRWRHRLPDEAAVRHAGMPDRFLLHVGYALLGGGLATHLGLLALQETFFGQPAEYFTAALVFGIVAGMAVARPPATVPVYNSWRLLQPWLPEAALLFGTATLWHNIRTPWLALVWVSAALALGYGAARLPVRLQRLGVYGRLYYWLAAGTAGVASLVYLRPSRILTPAWWEITAATCLLFGYVWQSLAGRPAPLAGLSPAWAALARLPRRQLEAWLLYPAFVALALLLIQSFDRSVLTVLLMLEVVAIFSTSLLLRRQDLRYLSLAGMLACLVRLVFFDLSRSGTVTRAVVFIFMGLLLLGMNALYARFKARFMPDEPDATSFEQ